MIDKTNCWIEPRCETCSEEEDVCIKLVKLNFLYNLVEKPNGFPLNLRQHRKLRVDLDGTDREEFVKLSQLSKDVKNFVKKGYNLYIYSTKCGNGKTSWAIRFIQNYLEEIALSSELRCRALFINVPKFLIELKNNLEEKREYIENIQENIESADLVVWDDIGTKAITTFEAENLLSMVDARIHTGKSNIFTSNLKDSELSSLLGNRLASRISGSTFKFELKGKDKRGTINE